MQQTLSSMANSYVLINFQTDFLTYESTKPNIEIKLVQDDLTLQEGGGFKSPP